MTENEKEKTDLIQPFALRPYLAGLARFVERREEEQQEPVDPELFSPDE